MYAIILRYTRPLADVETLLEAHRAWLRDNYAAGRFLLAGPQRPRTGGFILAAAMERDELDALLGRDPFHQAGVAAYEVVEFAPTTADKRLAALVEVP